MKPTTALALLCLSACSTTATLTPLNPAAQQAGAPTFEVTRNFLDHGPVRITMPDGEILTGGYQEVASGAPAAPSKPRGATTGAVPAAARTIFVSAMGPHTSLSCQGQSAPAHGAGTCRTQAGAEYQFVF